MACPRCGGSQRQLLSPGLYRCTQTTLEPGWSHAPGEVDLYPVECGLEYQEGPGLSALGTCACGMGAVGACARHGCGFCGTHRVLIDGRYYCRSCADAVQLERWQQRRQRWWEYYESIPQGGPDELRARLEFRDFWKRDKITRRHRFDELDRATVEVVASEVMRKYGASNKEIEDSLEKWRHAEPQDLPRDLKIDPLEWNVADPRCLSVLEFAIDRFEDRRKEEDSKQANYRERKQRYDAYRSALHLRLGGLGLLLAIAAGLVLLMVATKIPQLMIVMVAVGLGVFALIVNIFCLCENPPLDPDKPYPHTLSWGD